MDRRRLAQKLFSRLLQSLVKAIEPLRRIHGDVSNADAEEMCLPPVIHGVAGTEPLTLYWLCTEAQFLRLNFREWPAAGARRIK